MSINKQFDKHYKKLIKEHEKEERKQERKIRNERNWILFKNKIKKLLLNI